jgi:hypothetical protein
LSCETILYAEDGPIGALTLNRPEDGNMLTPIMCHEVRDCINLVRRETGSEPAPGPEAAVDFAVIDILQGFDKADRDPAGKPGERVGERVRARPPHPLEQGRQARPAPGADEPEPAIGSRAKDQIVNAEQSERGGDAAGVECRDVAADEHRRTVCSLGKRTAHAPSEVAGALPEDFYPPPPMPGMTARPVRGYGDPQIPASIGRQAAQQQADHQALEPYRRDVADLAREPALAVPEGRRAHEQDELAAHHW